MALAVSIKKSAFNFKGTNDLIKIDPSNEKSHAQNCFEKSITELIYIFFLKSGSMLRFSPHAYALLFGLRPW